MNESCTERACAVSAGYDNYVLSPVANKRANISSTIRLLPENCQLFVAVVVTKSERSKRNSTGAAGCRHHITSVSSVGRWQYPNSTSHRSLFTLLLSLRLGPVLLVAQLH